MDLMDLGFAEISPEDEMTETEKMIKEQNEIARKVNCGELTRKEAVALYALAREKAGLPPLRPFRKP